MDTISTEDTSSVSFYDSQLDRWSLLPAQWSAFMAKMGHLWWGSAPLDRIDEIIAQMPNGSMILHDPLPNDRYGTICVGRIKVNVGYKRFTVQVQQDSAREMYVVGRREHLSLLDAFDYVKRSVENGCFLSRILFEPTPNSWLQGSFDTIVQGVKDLRQRLYDENKFWGAVRDESFNILRKHIRKHPRITPTGSSYGMLRMHPMDICSLS